MIGGIIGLLKGGPAGLLFGVFLGHMVDRFLAGLSGSNRTRDAFFGAMFSTLGHINKADGRVTKAEIAAAEQLMRRCCMALGVQDKTAGRRYLSAFS